MATRFEWAHATDEFALVSPEELAELSEDGNDDGDYGLAFSTGSNGCMIYGSLDQLHSLVVGIALQIEAKQQQQ